MIRIAIALVVGGAILTFFGYNETKLAGRADSEPQTITAADLIANGPGENAHVTVTDAYILESYYAYYYEDKPQELEDVYIPVVSMDDPWSLKVQQLVDEALEKDPNNPDFSALENVGSPDNIKLVIHSKELNSETAVDTFTLDTTFTGLVVNEIEDLDTEVLNGLRELYPSMDAGSVYLIEHNRKPKSAGATMGMMIGGVLLILAGPGLFFLGRSKSA